MPNLKELESAYSGQIDAVTQESGTGKSGSAHTSAHLAVRLVAAGPNDVSRGVRMTDTRLPSLDTPHVLDWPAHYEDSPIFALPEQQQDQGKDADKRQSQDKSSQVVEVEPSEYGAVLGLMPG
jgi:hypothetical protein